MADLSGDAVTAVPTSEVVRERGRGRGRGEVDREPVSNSGLVGNKEFGETGAGDVGVEEHVMV
jgi:hypothetical protein